MGETGKYKDSIESVSTIDSSSYCGYKPGYPGYESFDGIDTDAGGKNEIQFSQLYTGNKCCVQQNQQQEQRQQHFDNLLEVEEGSTNRSKEGVISSKVAQEKERGGGEEGTAGGLLDFMEKETVSAQVDATFIGTTSNLGQTGRPMEPVLDIRSSSDRTRQAGTEHKSVGFGVKGKQVDAYHHDDGNEVEEDEEDDDDDYDDEQGENLIGHVRPSDVQEAVWEVDSAPVPDRSHDPAYQRRLRLQKFEAAEQLRLLSEKEQDDRINAVLAQRFLSDSSV